MLTSPLGPLVAEYDLDGVGKLLFWSTGKHPPAGTRDEPARGDEVGTGLARQLREYFAGERQKFELPLTPQGTDFQRNVWDALLEIPWSETRSYLELAQRFGGAGAARAVGSANGANPLPILIPCHRVITASGKLGGYSGGLDAKRWLLRHEGVTLRSGEERSMQTQLGLNHPR